MSSFQPVHSELDPASWLDLVSRYALSGAEETAITLSELASSAPKEQSPENESLQKVIEAVETLVKNRQFFDFNLRTLVDSALNQLRRAAVRSPAYSELRDQFTPSPQFRRDSFSQTRS